MKKESLAKQAVQTKSLWIKIFVRICVFLMAFSLIWVYIAYMIAPAQEANIDEINDTEITDTIEEEDNNMEIENNDSSFEENITTDENMNTSSEEL